MKRDGIESRRRRRGVEKRGLFPQSKKAKCRRRKWKRSVEYRMRHFRDINFAREKRRATKTNRDSARERDKSGETTFRSYFDKLPGEEKTNSSSYVVRAKNTEKG